MIGRTFGRYRIVESLGEGGMGTVWKAEDDLLGRSVALKLLSIRLTDSGSARARLLREARAAGALDHPGIGTVYDAGEQDGEIFIAMRLVDGGTVADRIQSQGALGLLDAVRIAASAADALGHAHARGILHRDVSARNLMLTKDGQVIVVDFGLALAEGASRLTQSGTTVGTAYYMAPEIALGQQADKRSDVYSLGAVLYEMLAGAPPFVGDRLEAVIYAAVHEPAIAPSEKRPGIPAELDRIVVQALAKSPEARYASMEALRDDLDALEVSGTLPEDAAPPTIQPRLQSLAPTTSLDPESLGLPRAPGRKRRIAIVATIVGLLAIMAVGIAWLLMRPTPAHPTYRSLAVLPFKNTSEKPAESSYLAEGLSQTLINKLTQMSTLHVPPWNTVGRFTDQSIPVKKLATELRVDALLFGTIRADGQRIHGTVSIVDGKSGFQVWAEDFDEPLADLFTVQNRIAIGAATKLLGKLSGRQTEVLAVPAAASIEAYEYYLKGSHALRSETQADNEEALGLFRRAIERDPRNAPAWVGVGTVHVDRYSFGWDGDLKDLAAAEEAYGRALEYDPNSIPARRGLMRVYWYRGKFEECLKQGKLIAASGATGSDATMARAEAYLFGDLAYRAISLLRQVMEEEPANPAAPWMMTIGGDFAGRSQECVDAGEKFLTAFGEDSEVHVHMASSFELMGRGKEAELHYRRGIETEPNGRSGARLYFAFFLRRAGRLDESDRMALDTIDALEDKLQRSPDNCWLRENLGNAYGLVGDSARMREEQDRVRHECGEVALFNFFDTEEIAGDKAKFLDRARTHIRAGSAGVCAGGPGSVFDRRFADWPGYKELAAEAAVNCKRLDALY